MKKITTFLILTLACGIFAAGQNTIHELRAEDITSDLLREMNSRIQYREITPSGFTNLKIEYPSYYTFSLIRTKFRAVIDMHPDAKIFQPWNGETNKNGTVTYTAIIQIGNHQPRTYMMVVFIPTIQFLTISY